MSVSITPNPNVQGPQGLTGSQGTQGVTGTQGLTGTQGTSGADGAQGLTGIQGLTGAQGTQGVQGVQGLLGTAFTATFDPETTAYTLQLANVNQWVTMSSGSSQTITVPPNVFSSGQLVYVQRIGSGAVPIAQGAGVTITSNGATSSAPALRAQFSSATILCTGTNTFTVGTDGWVNLNTYQYIALCWAAITGYSAFGSYTGNGSTDGPFVYCGFRPKWLFVIKSSNTSYWQGLDTARSPYNLAGEDLLFDLADAEKTIAGGFNQVDILSNGFKIRNTNCNDSGGTYIFGAFAEHPFKNSLAR
jgi:3D (Asp-Asp-Asp) domain-containing protein